MVSISPVLIETHVLYVELSDSNLCIQINHETGTAQRKWDWRGNACWIPMQIQVAERVLAAYATTKLVGGVFEPLHIIYGSW